MLRNDVPDVHLSSRWPSGSRHFISQSHTEPSVLRLFRIKIKPLRNVSIRAESEGICKGKICRWERLVGVDKLDRGFPHCMLDNLSKSRGTNKCEQARYKRQMGTLSERGEHLLQGGGRHKKWGSVSKWLQNKITLNRKWWKFSLFQDRAIVIRHGNRPTLNKVPPLHYPHLPAFALYPSKCSLSI